MEGIISILKNCRLFEGLNVENIMSALTCLNAKSRTYPKGSLIFAEGTPAEYIAVVIEGEIETSKTDFFGNVNMMSRLFASDLVAAVASYSCEGRLPFDVRAVCDTTLLCFGNKKLITPCQSACGFHAKIVANMLRIIADKNIQLAAKIDILSKRTTREKILAFLQANTRGESIFVTLNRQQMSEYLSVDRSALSRELSKMQDEGIISFSNNHFEWSK